MDEAVLVFWADHGDHRRDLTYPQDPSGQAFQLEAHRGKDDAPDVAAYIISASEGGER